MERGIEQACHPFAMINWMEECVFGEEKRRVRKLYASILLL